VFVAGGDDGGRVGQTGGDARGELGGGDADFERERGFFGGGDDVAGEGVEGGRMPLTPSLSRRERDGVRGVLLFFTPWPATSSPPP